MRIARAPTRPRALENSFSTKWELRAAKNLFLVVAFDLRSLLDLLQIYLLFRRAWVQYFLGLLRILIAVAIEVLEIHISQRDSATHVRFESTGKAWGTWS